MTDPIVLIGSPTDEQLAAVAETLGALGHEPLIVDPRRFPSELRVSLGEALPAIEVDGRRLSRPAAVYLRSLYQDPSAYGVDAEEQMANDWRRTLAAFRERATVVSALLHRWERAGVPTYNPAAAGVNITKPYQLALLEAAGLPVPATIWTNDPDAVRGFCEGRDVVYKPVSGGSSTRRIEARDLTPERLATLAAAPVCFQELLPGRDLRVYVLDGRLVCALAITTDALDFRGHEQAITPIVLPSEIAAHCLRATEVLGLRWTGMDLKEDRDGNPRILELNASPMFVGFDRQSGSDIRGALCRALLSHL